MYKSVFNEKRFMHKHSEYQVYDLPKPPVVVSTGAERISADGFEPRFSLTRNAPVNV